MEILLFTLVGIILYVTSDGIVKLIEKRRGSLLPNRSMLFFVIIMVLSTITFNLLQTYGSQFGLLPTSQLEEEKATPTPTPTPKEYSIPE